MNFVLVALVLVVVGLSVLTGKLWLKMDDIDDELDELDENITSTFGAVGSRIGELTVRADRLEVQLGSSGWGAGAGNKAQSADVFDILNEAQAWAAANEPVPVVQGFVGFPQDYDPSYHFGGQQLLPKLSDIGRDYSKDV